MVKKGLSRLSWFGAKAENLKSVVDFNARTSDEDLMRAYQLGNESAFTLLVERHQKPIFNFIRKFFPHPEESEEVFQETFLRIVRSAQDFELDARFKTWLYTVARNCCIDRYRKRKLRQEVSLDQSTGTESDSTLQDKIPSDSASADVLSSTVELEKQLARVLDTLNADQREVFVLRHFQGLVFEEIADIAGVSVNTVKSRMRYALKSIQKAFGDLGIDDFIPSVERNDVE